MEEINDDGMKVTTLRDLQKRRQELLRKRQSVLDKNRSQNPTIYTYHNIPQKIHELPKNLTDVDEDIANCDTLTTCFPISPSQASFTAIPDVHTEQTFVVLPPDYTSTSSTFVPIFTEEVATDFTHYDPSSSSNIIPNVAEETVTQIHLENPSTSSTDVPPVAQETIVHFSPDDSTTDPDYVPLSDITNIEPMESNDPEWFPERNLEPEAGRDSRKRKRKADSETWKRQLNKKDRMLGKAYLGFKKVGNNYHQKEPKPERSMGPKCMSAFCIRSKIFFCPNLSEDIRKDVFNRFWSMTWFEKKMYVRSMIDTEHVKRKTIEGNSRRSDTKLYYLQIDGKKERVCLKTFLATLGIKEWTVRYWLGDKTLVNSVNSNPAPISHNSKRDSVKCYLSLLPKLPSHYCRQSTTKQYVEPIIQSKAQLYKLYVEYSSSEAKPVASRKLFFDILSEENIALFQPKKDACDYCSSYAVGNVSEEDYQRHVELKNLARAEKTKDKEIAKQGIAHTITADLQAVKLCPTLSASALYFKTKLAVHNFTVFNIGTNDVTCYWFDETACDLKATTYASFFVDYITKLLQDNLKDVIIWTDGCTAQNRNSIVSNALLRLAMDKKVTITQKYLEKGHTQMEVDSVHSLIERKLKNVEIFLPSQYATITKVARKNPFPYKVEQPDHTFFKDYSVKEYQVYDSIRPGRVSGDDCVVDLRVLKYNPNGTIEFKKHFESEFTPLPRRPKNISTLLSNVPRLYESRLPILESKYEHLQQLKTVIPRDCHQFYDDLPSKKISSYIKI